MNESYINNPVNNKHFKYIITGKSFRPGVYTKILHKRGQFTLQLKISPIRGNIWFQTQYQF